MRHSYDAISGLTGQLNFDRDLGLDILGTIGPMPDVGPSVNVELISPNLARVVKTWNTRSSTSE